MKVLYNRHKNIKEEAFVVEPVIVRVTKFMRMVMTNSVNR